MTSHIVQRVERPFSTSVVLPGSKSIALRHIVMATLADAPTRLRGVPRCDDVDTMLNAVGELGVEVLRDGKTALLTPPATPAAADAQLHLGMSGVSLRLLLAHAALRTSTTRFDGHQQLRQRPNADLLDALERLGCTVESTDGGFLPIAVAGPAGPAAETTLNASVSSQYLSALMLAAPALADGLTIRLQDQLASASYVGVTRAEMARRGIRVHTVDDATLHVPAGRYLGGGVDIEGDASAATYHAALATLHGGEVRLANLGVGTHQGEAAFLGLCETMGARVDRERDGTRIRGPQRLAPVNRVDMRDMPDAAPTLMALAPFLPQPTRIDGLASLRVKECDRLAAGTAELRKAGVAVTEYADAMVIEPTASVRPTAFETYEDHRMAMALSVLASKVGGCTILGADCVSKTYADYWNDFAGIYRAA